jgi:glycosyltransferase involved in cell wall biosynthesis
VLRRADIITCDADHMVDAMVRLGADRGQIRIVYFGTDLTRFNEGRRDAGLAAQLGFPANAPLVISLRALKPVYDVETFVRAAARVAREMPAARFVVVGDGPERQRLEALARELGVAEIVRFTGRLSDADLQRYTASATVYVSTSLSDAGLAASTSEAMACAVPVVITRFGNNGDWVQEGLTGSLFGLKDDEELARKVLALLKAPELARSVAVAGRKVIEERNNWHREMEKVERLYEHLIAEAAGSATRNRLHGSG